jgi:hypothetical protein
MEERKNESKQDKKEARKQIQAHLDDKSEVVFAT